MRESVLVLANFIAGLYSFRKELIKAIIDRGYLLYISVPDTEDDRVNYFKSIGCKIVKTDFNRRGMNPIADINLMLTYCRLLKKIHPKVVLSYTIKPNVYGGIACRLIGVPQIANVTGLGDAVENGGWLQKLTVFLYKIGVSKAIRVFFQNNSNRDFCLRFGIADENSVVLPGSGVNLEYHSYQTYPSDGIIRFLFISRLLKDKGTDEFLEMAEAIKDKKTNTEFQILGWIEEKYKKRINDLVERGIVKYLGTASDVRKYIADVHCTIMPSYHEGMSNVNLESAANGRPVITTNVPGCRETVDDGLTGFLVKAKDAKSLITGVERFLNLTYEKKKQMGIEARKKIEREFDRRVVIDAYLKEINSISDQY